MASIAVALPDEPRAFERALLRRGWEVAVAPWPQLDAVYLRVSAHLYNALDDAKRLAALLAELGVRSR